MVKPPANRSVDWVPPQIHERRGVSLVEILFVVAILALVAVGTITYFQPSITDELENAAQIVLADVERTRNLSVANNSKYKLAFHNDGSGYYLQHSGSSTSLNPLPSWPYKQATDSADKQTTLLKKLPGLGDVDLIGVVKVASSGRTRVSELEFTSVGATSSAETTEIWLAAGSGVSRRYLTVTINPTTGLADVGDIAGAAPTVNAASGGGSDGGSSGTESGGSSGSSGLQVSLDLLGTSVSVGVGGSGSSGGTIIDLGLGS
jgi:prepilin-type N-terminal cleavage/methylation domain-containing protein